MLLHLSVTDFTIATHIDVEFKTGMTVITGETGAGKSIMVDALGLALGGRGDASVVRAGAEFTDIHASFDIQQLSDARDWLQRHDLAAGDECLLRRVITREGRSRAYINGRPVTLTDMKTLAEMLIDIHSQHAHQSLLKKDPQRLLLDSFAGLESRCADLRQIAQDYHRSKTRLDDLREQQNEQSARVQLLRYQVEELDQLAISDDEISQLEQEQIQLASGEQILQGSQHALALCTEGELNVVAILNQAIRSLATLPSKSAALTEAEEMLNNALIQAEEAGHNLQQHIDSFELDPQRLFNVEQRLSAIYDVARKHRIPPEELNGLHQSLVEELNGIAGNDAELNSLEERIDELQTLYQHQAMEISKKRQTAAGKLQKQVEQQLSRLAMANCRFQVRLQERSELIPHPHGQEDVAFLVSTNPGQPPQSLAKVASGGELSRISLAIQVITAKTSATPTLVFDEVDVGIGGAVAEVVGNLLQDLGESGQIICVTHQPQVAAKGHHHLLVEKHSSKKAVATTLEQLSDSRKINEIARMLGGIAITEQSLAHAKEMLTH